MTCRESLQPLSGLQTILAISKAMPGLRQVTGPSVR